MKGLLKTSLGFIAAIGVCVLNANAQQTIFNVPSSDILDKGKVYVELDSTFKLNNDDSARRFSSFVPRIVVGAGKDVEVGLNLNGNIQPGADATTLVPNVKWRVYNGENNGVQIVFGSNLFVPVRNKSYNFGNYSYAQISKTFRKTGTRVTGGGFVATKNVFASQAARGGGQFGFEQPVNKYLNFNADWITGRHGAGYFTPGIAVRANRRVTA